MLGNHITKNLPLNIFDLIRYQNTKTHAKKALWRNRITLPKTCILSLFDHVKTLKNMQRTLCLGNERTLRETCIMSVFKFLKYQKAKITNNTLYREYINKKRNK